MTENPHVALIRWTLEAIKSGESEAVAEIWADEIEWHQIGRAEPIRSKEELFAYLAEDDPVEHDWEVHDVVGNDDHVVALSTDTATFNGRSITSGWPGSITSRTAGCRRGGRCPRTPNASSTSWPRPAPETQPEPSPTLPMNTSSGS